MPKEQFIDLAKQRVSLGLLFREYIRVHHLKVDPQRVQATLERIASSYKDPASVMNWYRSNKEQMAILENMVLEEQIIDELMTKAKIEEKPISYADFAKGDLPQGG